MTVSHMPDMMMLDSWFDCVMPFCVCRLAAEQGNSSAQNNLGSCYAGGSGVAQDFVEAVKWFELAAKGGHGPAQYNLGLCYFHGALMNRPSLNCCLTFP